MKKVILAIIIAGFVVGTIACTNPLGSEVFLSTSSPNKTYTVEFTGNKDTPNSFAVDHEARFNLFKSGQSLVKEAHVDKYDWFDSGFADMYPEHRWVSDSVLRFGHSVEKSEQSPDSLSVSNDTNKTVKYLKITAADMIFVFEMPPKSKMKLKVPNTGWSMWIWSEGEFSDGRRIKGNGANFFHKDKLNEPLRFCVSVTDEIVKVESPIMDGYLNGTSENPDKPKAANCDL